jgi:uncharacterized protein YndB with AHSA1/START domain
MDEKNSGTATASAQDLAINRTFDAPRDIVWKAWTERMGEWSGPKGFTIPVGEGDVRPGGKWHAVMRKPDGTELKLGGVYREVIPPERLVFTHSWQADSGDSPETIVMVVLIDRGNKTEMKFSQTGFDSTGARDGHREGWGSSFDRLDELLAEG